jgi:hypothetical protein
MGCRSAGQLCYVGVELFYTLLKLMHADALGFLEHVCDVVLLLLSRVVGKHGVKVEHHAVIKWLAQKSPGYFLGTAL